MSANLFSAHLSFLDSIKGVLEPLGGRIASRESYNRAAFYADAAWMIRQLKAAGLPWINAAWANWSRWADELDAHAADLGADEAYSVALPAKFERSDADMLRDFATATTFLSYYLGQLNIEFWDRDRDGDNGAKHTFAECIKLTFRVADWMQDHILKGSDHDLWLSDVRSEMFDLFRTLGEGTHSGSLGEPGEVTGGLPWSQPGS